MKNIEAIFKSMNFKNGKVGSTVSISFEFEAHQIEILIEEFKKN